MEFAKMEKGLKQHSRERSHNKGKKSQQSCRPMETQAVIHYGHS